LIVSTPSLTPAELDTLRAIPTPAVANAIETFALRPRTVGFAGPQVRQMFPALPPIIGYAVTARTIAARELASKQTTSRADYWRYLEASTPKPRIAVVEDMDDPPSIGAFFGEVNANIHRALGCVGAITNSGIRDLDEVAALGFPIWAGSVVVSHAYVRLVDFGVPVTIGGLAVQDGDLLLADRHGVIEIPLAIARAIPDAVRTIEVREKTIIHFCQSPEFSAAGLAELMMRL
jgi:regulator of RNase E activity RraA